MCFHMKVCTEQMPADDAPSFCSCPLSSEAVAWTHAPFLPWLLVNLNEGLRQWDQHAQPKWSLQWKKWITALKEMPGARRELVYELTIVDVVSFPLCVPTSGPRTSVRQCGRRGGCRCSWSCSSPTRTRSWGLCPSPWETFPWIVAIKIS